MTDQTVTLRITTDARGVVTGAAVARDAIKGIGTEARGAAATASNAADMIRRQVTQLAGAYVSLRGVMALGRMADEYTSISGKLRLAAGSASAFALAQRQVYSIAQETAAALGPTATLYARMTSALGEYGATQQQVANITRTVNQALRVSGATAAESASAILQLSQAFGSGRLSGEEFNAVNEAAPRLMQALARSMGVPRGALKELAAEGKITSQVLMEAFSGDQAAQIAAEAAQIPLTFGAAFTQLENAMTRYVGQLDQAYGVSSTLTQAISSLAMNFDAAMDSVMGLVQAFAVLAGARAIGAALAGLSALRAAMLAPAAIAAAGTAWQALGVTVGGAAMSMRGLGLAGDAMGKSLLSLAGGPVAVAVGALGLLALKVKETWDQIEEAERRGATSIERARGSIGQGFAGAARPRANIEEDVTRLSGLMARDAGRDQALKRHEQSLERLRQQYMATGATVEQWNAVLARSESAAAAARAASTEQGRALAALSTIASDAGVASAKQREAAEQLAARLREVAVQEAKGGEAARRAQALRAELVAQYARTVSSLAGVDKATRAATASQAAATRAENQRASSMSRLQEMLERVRGATNPLGEATARYASAVLDIAGAAQQAIRAGNDHAAVLRTVSALVAEEQAGFEQTAAAIQREAVERARLANVVGETAAGIEREAQLVGLSAREREIQVAILEAEDRARRAVEAGVRSSIELSAEEVEAIRARVGAAYDTIDASRAAQQSADEYQRTWLSAVDAVSRAFGDWVAGGMRSFKDLGRSLVNIARQWMAELVSIFARRLLLNVSASFGGGAGGGLNLGSLLGGGAGAGGLGGGLLGAALFGGGSGMTGIMNLLRGGTASSALGIQQVNAITGARGASGGAGSIFGGGMMQNGMSAGGMLGAAGGVLMGLQGIRTGNPLQGAAGGAMGGMSIAGPWGAAIGAIIGGLGALIRGNKPPDFRFGGASANVRNVEGGFDTVFGRVRAGSRQISWESVVEPMQRFDQTIQQMIQSLGGGDEQIERIRAALSTWSVDLKGDAATAEAILGSRFGAIMGTFDQHIRDFVGGTGTVEERVGRLADALTIDRFAESGELLSSFDELAGVLTRNRVGTEALADTYARVLGSTTLLESALELSGVSLDLTRLQFVNFAADIAEAAGGLDRAQQLWQGYFEGFYSAEERRALQVRQAQSAAAREFSDIGLNSTDFTGEGGAARFRQMFESVLPSLSADAVVQWLEAANALGVVIDLTGTYNEVLQETVDSMTGLDDLMGTVEEQIAGLSGESETYAQRLGRIGKDIELLVTQAARMGATEEQIARIRYLGQLRLGEVLDEQASARGEYDRFVGQFRPSQDAGLSQFQRTLRDIAREANDAAAEANRLAIAAGMAGAAESDLAAIHEAAAARAAQAAAELEASIVSLADQLGYTSQAAEEAIGGTGALNFAHWLQQQVDAATRAPALDPQRYSGAVALAGQLRDLSEFTGDAVLETMQRLRVPLNRLVGDFGVDLARLDAPEVFDRLVQASRVLGAEVLDAAGALGVEVGRLEDASALVNDAFERALGRMPSEVRETVAPLLRAFEEAGSPEQRASARAALVDAVDQLPPSLRAALAPFLDEIDTTSVAEQQLSQIEQTNRYLSSSDSHLAAIRDALARPGAPGGVATPVTPVRPGEKSAGNADVVRELRELRAEVAALGAELRRVNSKLVLGA